MLLQRPVLRVAGSPRVAFRSPRHAMTVRATSADEATQARATSPPDTAANVVETVVEPPSTSAADAADPQSYQLIGPDPKRFTPGEGQLLDLASAAFPAVTRLGCGGFVYGYRSGLQKDDEKYGVLKFAGQRVSETSSIQGLPRPAQPLVLYEFEGCPFCRKVREAMVVLDLDCVYYPCPKDGPTWRPQAVEKGGKAQFPYLVDPNSGVAMYESDDIIKYLFKTYGPGEEAIPRMLRLGALTAITAGIGMVARGRHGSYYVPSVVASRPDIKPIVYYGYELSPFCKLVREVLSELELPHLYRTMGRGSMKRQEVFDKRGLFQVPYIEDPNTGYAMFESAAIVRYLRHTYGKDSQQ